MNTLFTLLLFFFNISNTSATTTPVQKKIIISIETNQSTTPIPIVIKRSENAAWNFQANSAQVVTKEHYQNLICQLDDIDGDGNTDEVVFLTIPGIQEYTLTLSEAYPSKIQESSSPAVFSYMGINDKKAKHPAITHLEVPGKSNVYSDVFPHGATWESDQTAYRLYFDHRQNIDIYGKRIRRLELPDTYFYTSDEQLNKQYGYDILWAGTSIACGSLKLWTEEGMANWTNVQLRGQRIIAHGPIRTIVEMTDKNTLWPEGYSNSITTHYTQYAHQRDVQVDIYSKYPLSPQKLCTGVQRIAGSKYRILQSEGIAATWGTDYPEQSNEKSKARFGLTSVGMAVYVPKRYVANIHEDSLNCLIILGKRPETHLQYHISFCTAMETWNELNNSNAWFNEVYKWVEECKTKEDKYKIKTIKKIFSRNKRKTSGQKNLVMIKK